MKRSHSSTKASEEIPFSSEQIHAFRLRRHHLLDRSAKDLVTICRDVCCVQAQIMSAAQLQLWARNHAITPAAVNNALWKTRSLVKTSLMRQTLHLVPADEFPLYIAAHKNARAKAVLSIMARCKITREEADALTALILEELKNGPSPRAAITAAVRPKVSRRLRVWMDKVWSIVRLPVIEGLVCYGPGEGNQATFIRTEHWLPVQSRVDAVKFDAMQAQQELFRKYLRAYGPATLQDFAHWSLISMAEVRALRPLLDSEIAEHNGLLLLREDMKILQATSPEMNSVHLLPYFDVYLLAHRFKEHFLKPQFYKRVYRNQGWISPVVLINGEIAGVWSYKLSRKAVEIEVELFARVGPRTRKQIRDRAKELADLFQSPLAFSFKS
ncbi:MAG TPA: winged helix DNA-binding domain-containing protein [Candidatus Acidoferrales bacterium]|nr:winged helix DNA-binding domain-containing protein [Candidatus Acidoferrales bacterium]